MDAIMELEALGTTTKYTGQADYGEEIESDMIYGAMVLFGRENTRDDVEAFLERASVIQEALLSLTLCNYIPSTKVPPGEPLSGDASIALKKARRSIRLLANMVQRSPAFASKMSSECVELLEAILAATTYFDTECLLILVKTSEWTWLEFQKSPRYSQLLETVLKKNKDSTMLLAYFSTLLEKDYGLLSSCYAEMQSESFCELLEVVKVIVEHQDTLKIHSNNLLFVLNLLELITVDYNAFLMAKSQKEPKSVEDKRQKTVEMANLLVEIVGDMCTNTEMTSHLNEKATAINAVVDVLDSILHAESLFSDFRCSQSETWPELPLDDPKFDSLRQKIEEEKRYEETQRKYGDRPKQPPPSKIQRIEISESLSQLAHVIFEQYQKIDDVIGVPRIGELKLNCLQAISNLCGISPGNKLATVQNGRQGLLSVLQCTSRRPAYFMESYAMRNYAIFCVRQLTDECQENKEVILNLGEPQQPIIDRKRLLKEFGIDEEELKKAEPTVQ